MAITPPNGNYIVTENRSHNQNQSNEQARSNKTSQSLVDSIRRHAHIVPYVKQSYSWDCGLACVMMILRAHRNIHTSLKELRTLCSTNSVWSIDIAYLLQQFDIDAIFYTVKKGVRPEYEKQEFYHRQFAEDTKRVTRLFKYAEESGVRVVEQHVPLPHIRSAVTCSGKLVLILLDKRKVRCLLCDHELEEDNRGSGDGRTGGGRNEFKPIQMMKTVVGTTTTTTTTTTISSKTNHNSNIYNNYSNSNNSITSDLRLFNRSTGGGFIGHFVLLYGYYAPLDAFLVKDPAAIHDVCVIKADVIEQARLTFGTDQDVILIRHKTRCTTTTVTTATTVTVPSSSPQPSFGDT